MPISSQKEILLCDVLRRLSDQLAFLAAHATALETVSSALTQVPAPFDREALIGLQSIDYIKQNLGDLAHLVDLLAQTKIDGGISPQDARALAAQMQLSTTQALLGVSPSAPSDDPDTDDEAPSDPLIF